MELFIRLWNALISLPEIQGRRIDAHIILGKSIKEIAEVEGVHEESVRQSIKRGLERMKIGDTLILFLVPCILLIHPAFDEKRKRTNQQTDGSRNRPENIFLHSFHPNQKSRILSVAAIVA